jgi:hypothetical protein
MLKVVSADGSKTAIVYRYGRKYFFSNTISGLVLPLVGIDLWYVVLTGTGPNPGRSRELVKGFHRAVVRAEALCFGEPTGWEPASGRLSADAADELTNSHRLKVASFRFAVTTLQLLVIGVIISPLWSGKHLWGPGLLLAMVIYALLNWVLTSPLPERSRR